MKKYMKTNEIRIRDPYVLVHNGCYYMYRSDSEKNVYVHKSEDLKNWDEGKTVYTLNGNLWAYKDVWAPEVHFYRGKFYMFVSLLGKNGLRGTEINICDTPDGVFKPISNGPATPKDKSCIDGTLYVENDVPYIVYSADWPHNFDAENDCYVGEIWAKELSEDLKTGAGDPFLLFKSNEAPCSKNPAIHEYEGKTVTRYGSDAPFIVKLSNGMLYLTWSPIPNNNYIVAGAVADSIKGKWHHIKTPLFDKNGGHAMFFTDLEKNLRMCIHCPERTPDERALFIKVNEENGILTLEGECDEF